MAETSVGVSSGPRDRVEDLLSSIVGLDHIKSQVRFKKNGSLLSFFPR